MAFTKALYYPRIEVPDEAWLKTAALYWETIQTIVPASMDQPYSRPTDLELFDAKVLSPLHVHPQMASIARLAEKVIDYISSPQAERLLCDSGIDEYALVHPEYALLHPDKISAMLEESNHLHPDKLPFTVQLQLERVFRSRKKGEWLKVDPAFANFYMTLLATELSAETGAGLLTDMPSGDQLSTLARLDGPLGFANLRIPVPERDRYRYERRVLPGSTAQGLLAELTLNRLTVSRDTPVSEILKFREDHKSELGRFRTKLGDLTKSVEQDLPMEALQQRVADVYSNEVRPAFEEMKDSLSASRIKWAVESFSKTSFLSVSTGGLLMHIGLSTPQALLASAGVSLVASAVLYNTERRQELRRNPFSYVLAAEKRFGS